MEIWDKLLLHKEGKLSYSDGVALFFVIHPERRSLKAFFNKEDRYSRKKIKEALDAKFFELEANQQQNKFKSFGPSKHKDQPINVTILPAELRAEYARLSPIIREISSLHARLFNCSTNEQRFDLAKKIVHLVGDRRGIFTKIDAYMQSGTVLLPKKVESLRVDQAATKDFEIEYKLKLLRSRKVKLAKNPRRLDDYNKVVNEINQLLIKRSNLA